MGIATVLIRLIIIRHNGEQAVDARFFSLSGEFDSRRRVIGADVGYDESSVPVFFGGKPEEPQFFFFRKRSPFAGRAADKKAVRTVGEKVPGQRIKIFEVDVAVCIKGRHHSSNDISER